MTTRRSFLTQTLSLVASPYMPVSPARVVAQSAVAAIPVAPLIVSPRHIDAIANIAISAFDVNCAYEINPFPLFDDMEDLRSSPLAHLEAGFTSIQFDELRSLIEGLQDLPDYKKGSALDGFAWNVLQIYAVRLEKINHLLSLSDEHLDSLQSAPGFKAIITDYYEAGDFLELKALGAQELSRHSLVSELRFILEDAFDIFDRILRIRKPEAGMPATAAGYMTALMAWAGHEDDVLPERGDDIGSADFSQALKIWMEKEFFGKNQFRLGLYDIPEAILSDLIDQENKLDRALFDGHMSALAYVGDAVIAEELFGSDEAKLDYLLYRAANDELCRVVDQVAETCPRQKMHMNWSAIFDPTSAQFNVRTFGLGSALARDVIGELKALFPDAVIEVMENPAEAEGQVLNIAYADAEGQAGLFAQALSAALREKELMRAGQPSASPQDAAKDAPGPKNPPSPQ